MQRVVRTPLPALVTLIDDPLRVFRVIRFACRFNFSIADDLAEVSTADGSQCIFLKTISDIVCF